LNVSGSSVGRIRVVMKSGRRDYTRDPPTQ
jgi:hypothetical protein